MIKWCVLLLQLWIGHFDKLYLKINDIYFINVFIMNARWWSVKVIKYSYYDDYEN